MTAAGPYAFTHIRPDGNRVLEGTGVLPRAPLTYDLDFEPAWLVGLPETGASVWVVVGTDGTVTGIRLDGGAIESFDPTPSSLPTGMPPVLAGGAERPQLLTAPTTVATDRSHPFPLGDGRVLLIGAAGDVLLWDGEIVDRLATAALPDARIVHVTAQTYVVLGGATTRYDHGALGDGVEAARMEVFQVGDGLTRRSRISFDGAVVEGLLPIATAFDAAGPPRLIVTLTDQAEGAHLAAFGLDGEKIATGPSIGTGFRWRHQLCVAPFGPDGATEIAAVKTPHIGGVVEFYRRRGDRLVIVGTAQGYSSHAFGSRNLDGGLAADLDDDGALELLVPTQSRDALAAVRRIEGGLETPWRLPLPDRLTTNLAGVTSDDGRAIIAAGTGDRTLHVWR